MGNARIIQFSAAIAMLGVLALATELETGYVAVASAAGFGSAGSKLGTEPRSDFTFVDCASLVRSHCSDVERGCNATRRETVYECRRRYRLCVASSQCLQGSNSSPFAFRTLPRGAIAPEPACVLWLFPYSGRTGCNPATQRCICGRRDVPPVEVRSPGSPSGGADTGASVRVRPKQ